MSSKVRQQQLWRSAVLLRFYCGAYQTHMEDWRSTTTSQFQWVSTPEHPSRKQTPVRPGFVLKSAHCIPASGRPLQRPYLRPSPKTANSTWAQTPEQWRIREGALQPFSHHYYAHANLYIQLFPRDNCYSYVTSPEFCNLIGAFTFLRAAILLAQEIARMSPDLLPRSGRGLGTRLEWRKLGRQVRHQQMHERHDILSHKHLITVIWEYWKWTGPCEPVHDTVCAVLQVLPSDC